ncbi:hypothetical protein A2160_04830 [Candidatus Beckwithbacteria bacterium RBG_13_42_9]|uniref:Metallo-beta-lactamase domain-containing protein n=1 Tax=Candidatus Beckwithbacteria bacterium RBG_13_42_9 TaxID=1797457 RepID=A0A1F5E5T8_9BACT|nr:MAG: hypothetical protein A2160_04830 [Candidatus Beckwithbacteria bacterium RBG_13_42_9]
MKIISLVVGQLQTNCFLAVDQETDEALIIDSGDDAELIIQKIQDERIKPVGIVATHGHFDHCLAVLELRLAFSIPFYLHQNDLALLKRMSSSARHFLGIEVGPAPKVDRFIKAGDNLSFGKESFEVIETFGHTPGSISLYSQPNKVIFVGDTIFADGGVGRTDFSYSNEADLNKSIKKLLKLPAETLVYTGHGEETTIGEWDGKK